jgi:hypothetical protein
MMYTRKSHIILNQLTSLKVRISFSINMYEVAFGIHDKLTANFEVITSFLICRRVTQTTADSIRFECAHSHLSPVTSSAFSFASMICSSSRN